MEIRALFLIKLVGILLDCGNLLPVPARRNIVYFNLAVIAINPDDNCTGDGIKT